MDYYDDNPVKVNKYLKIIDKIRKKERKLKRQMKAAKKNNNNATTAHINFDSNNKLNNCEDTQTYQTTQQDILDNTTV